MEYNTARSGLTMKEYGRHIQKMVDYLLTIDDKEKRQEQAGVLIELMGFLNPHLKNVEDFRHKLWDHLYYMSDFKLDVDSPYPIPTRENYKVKPDPLPYPKRYPRKKHLGKNIEVVVEKALAEENEEKRQGLANAVAYYMKLSYNNWHKETVSDQVLQTELDILSHGQLTFNNAPYIRKELEDFKPSFSQINTGARKSYTQRNNNNNNNNNRNNNNRGNNNNNNNNRNNNRGNNNNNRGNNGFKKRY
ncbi:protein of unknown function [Arachidicoccus rhizosphaerae]|uniref:DUF4290 domain-containing protein n=1 Tax=Arachidicoccus rhizosphaerae TaxID=551991 RepID=A0A1H4C4R7_9BACT|nr:DUF4290 domain-containing protein [Arachidicoccus rhizosphaerae]SEA55340.1 protein of unknown function [Arachidicoccus rhizosphaerae]